MERKLGVEAGALAGLREQLEAAAGEADPFGDAGEAQRIVARERGGGVEAPAAIGDLDVQFGVARGDGDDGGVCARVAGDVGERLLHDAVGRNFEIDREPGRRERELEFDRNAGLAGKKFGLPVERGREAEVIEHARAERKRERPHALQEIVGDGERFVEGRAGFRGFELKAQAGEELADLIVEFLGEGAALVFLHAEEARRERLGAALGVAADQDLVFEFARAGGDLIGERAVECGEFFGELGVEPRGVGEAPWSR